MDFDAAKGLLACVYCGHTMNVRPQPKRSGIRPRKALREAVAKPARPVTARETLHQVQELRRVNTVDANVVSTECPFCGSNQVVPQSTWPR